jgi:hypothetical protein
MPTLLRVADLSIDQHISRIERILQIPDDDLTPNDFNKLVKSQEALRQHAREASRYFESKNPLAHALPSYLQSLKLNSWLTGRNFLLDFENNRQGKTAASVIRANLFMCPPDPIAKLFKAHEEINPLTAENPHKYQVLPPAPIKCIIEMDDNDPLNDLDPFLSHLHPKNLKIFLKAIKESQLLEHIRMDFDESGIYTPTAKSKIQSSFFPTNPRNLELDNILPNDHSAWHCSPDHKKFKAVCAKAWMRWTPPAWIKSYQEHDGIMKLSYPNGLSLEILSKSYDSSDDAFQGDAVRMILITEGPPKSKWEEIKLRFEYPALGSFDYTAAEPSNTNEASHLAEQIYKKKEEVPMYPICFSGFGIHFAPPHILPTAKKNDMIRMYSGKPEAEARLWGKFYTTTPRALHALDRDFHCLPLDFNSFVKQYYPGFDHDPSIKFRGYDEGSDSPSACVWAALMPDDVWVVYRAWEQRKLTTEQTCKAIITLSGNTRKERTAPASGDRSRSLDKWYREEQTGEKIVMTIADYHIFKEDKNSGKTHARDYAQQGLILRASITAGPEERVLMLNNKLTPYIDENFPDRKPQPKIVFLMKEPGVANMIDIFEEWYWERYVQGPNKDEPKDKVSDKNDHLADALCYVVLSPFRWSASLARQSYRNQFQSKPDEKYMEQLKEFYENAN